MKRGQRTTLEQKFWPKVDTQIDGCWLWTGSKSAAGYGVIAQEEHNIPAHRAAYEILVGPIGDGLQIDHLCRVPWCVAPEHLDPVTPAVNMQRNWTARRLNETRHACPHCKATLADPNLIFARDNSVSCRSCGTICEGPRNIQPTDNKHESLLGPPRLKAIRKSEYARLIPQGTEYGRRKLASGAYRFWCFNFEFFLIRIRDGWIAVEIGHETHDSFWVDCLRRDHEEIYPSLERAQQHSVCYGYFRVTGQIVVAVWFGKRC